VLPARGQVHAQQKQAHQLGAEQQSGQGGVVKPGLEPGSTHLPEAALQEHLAVREYAHPIGQSACNAPPQGIPQQQKLADVHWPKLSVQVAQREEAHQGIGAQDVALEQKDAVQSAQPQQPPQASLEQYVSRQTGGHQAPVLQGQPQPKQNREDGVELAAKEKSQNLPTQGVVRTLAVQGCIQLHARKVLEVDRQDAYQSQPPHRIQKGLARLGLHRLIVRDFPTQKSDGRLGAG